MYVLKPKSVKSKLQIPQPQLSGLSEHRAKALKSQIGQEHIFVRLEVASGPEPPCPAPALIRASPPAYPLQIKRGDLSRAPQGPGLLVYWVTDGIQRY